MPFVHIYFAYRITQLEIKMNNHKATYKNIIESSLEQDKTADHIRQVAAGFVRAKADLDKIMCIFQEIRLFEIVGESGPQAALQICFALRVGFTGWFQMFSIFISLLSLASGATATVLLYPTKNASIKKDVNWIQTWLMIFPLMFLISAPRLFCLGLELAYLKEMSIPIAACFCLMSLMRL